MPSPLYEHTPVPGGTGLITMPFTIKAGQTTSDEIGVFGAALVSIDYPAAMDGATLSFNARGHAGGTLQGVEDDTGPITLPIKAGKSLTVHPATLYGKAFLQLVSDVAQTTDRTLSVSFKLNM